MKSTAHVLTKASTNTVPPGKRSKKTAVKVRRQAVPKSAKLSHMAPPGMTIEDVGKLARAWLLNAQQQANAKQCADGICSRVATAQHGGSCACHPCQTAQAVVRFLADMDRSTEARHTKYTAPDPKSHADPK